MNSNPLVSICIPTYNSALFLTQTLDSIAKQTYENIEVIISDNASTDNTASIAQTYCARYDWRFYQNEINIGAGNNFNKLIDFATGEYIAIYHADDIYGPTIVEKSLQAFNLQKNIGIVGTMGTVIDSANELLYSFKLPQCINSFDVELLSFDDVFRGIISAGKEEIVFITPSIMVKKECYTSLGNFKIDERYKSAGDYEMWLRIANHFSTSIINEQLIQYRVHSGQGSESEIRQNLEVYDIVKVMDDYVEKVTTSQLKAKYILWREQLHLSIALKQNAASLYNKSNHTLIEVKKIKFLLPKFFLNTVNMLKISLPLDFMRTLFHTIIK